MGASALWVGDRSDCYSGQVEQPPEGNRSPAERIRESRSPDWRAFTGGNLRSIRDRGPRAALRRAVSRSPDQDGIGKLSDRIGLELLAAGLAGDTKRVATLTALIHELEGKPQESVEHSGSILPVRLVGFTSPVEDGTEATIQRASAHASKDRAIDIESGAARKLNGHGAIAGGEVADSNGLAPKALKGPRAEELGGPVENAENTRAVENTDLLDGDVDKNTDPLPIPVFFNERTRDEGTQVGGPEEPDQ